jgi:cobalamin synthase
LVRAVQDQLQTERPEQAEISQYLAPLHPQVVAAAVLLEVPALVYQVVLVVAAQGMAHPRRDMQAVQVIHRLPRHRKEIMAARAQQTHRKAQAVAAALLLLVVIHLADPVLTVALELHLLFQALL